MSLVLMCRYDEFHSLAVNRTAQKVQTFSNAVPYILHIQTKTPYLLFPVSHRCTMYGPRLPSSQRRRLLGVTTTVVPPAAESARCRQRPRRRTRHG